MKIDKSGTYMFGVTSADIPSAIEIVAPVEVRLFFFVQGQSSKLPIDINAEGAVAHVSVLVVAKNTTQSEADFLVSVNASRAKADMYALSLLYDNAKAKMIGGIRIGKDVIEGEGYLQEENLLLGKNISIKALPMLDVLSNNVKASHGAKIERLQNDHIFYLQAKGIPGKMANEMLVDAYITKALEFGGVGEDFQSEIKNAISAIVV